MFIIYVTIIYQDHYIFEVGKHSYFNTNVNTIRLIIQKCSRTHYCLCTSRINNEANTTGHPSVSDKKEIIFDLF